MMRRALALLTLIALLSAQASALACPTTHHGNKDEHASHQHEPSVPSPAHDGGIPDHCIMMTSCTAVTSVANVAAEVYSATSQMTLLVLSASQYSAPALGKTTPPPRSA
jgi:hypothetical protein